MSHPASTHPASSHSASTPGFRVPIFALLVVSLVLVAPPAAVAQDTPERDGFTMLLSLGAGLQDDGALPESGTGFGGLNLGIGGFLNERVALWFRVSGTTVTYDTPFGDLTQTSGFGGPALQYWVSERFAVEGGLGFGFWSAEDADDTGMGLMLGGDFVVWTNGPHSLHLGVEYAPAFTDPDTVHNYGLVFGWQKN